MIRRMWDWECRLLLFEPGRRRSHCATYGSIRAERRRHFFYWRTGA